LTSHLITFNLQAPTLWKSYILFAFSGVFPDTEDREDYEEDENEQNENEIDLKKKQRAEFIAWYSLDQLREICQAAVKAVRYDYPSSHVVWNAWRDVEMRVLEVLVVVSLSFPLISLLLCI
jgi:hypothetical protein